MDSSLLFRDRQDDLGIKYADYFYMRGMILPDYLALYWTITHDPIPGNSTS